MTKHICTKETVFTKIFVAQAALQKDIKYIRKAINGNGSFGLIRKSEEAHNYILSQKQKEQNKKDIEEWSRKKLLFWLGILFGIPGILLFILQIIIMIQLNGG